MLKKVFITVLIVGVLLMNTGCSLFSGVSKSTIEKYISAGIEEAIEEFFILPEGTIKTNVSYKDVAEMLGEESLVENGLKLTFTAFKDPNGEYLYFAGPNEVIVPIVFLKSIGWDQKQYSFNIWKVNDEQTAVTGQFEIYIDLSNEGALLPQTFTEYSEDGYTEYKYFGLRDYSLKNEVTTDENKKIIREISTINMFPVYQEFADEGVELSGDYVTIIECGYDYDADGRVVKEKTTLLKICESEGVGIPEKDITKFIELFSFDLLDSGLLDSGDSCEKTYIYYPDAPLQGTKISGFGSAFFKRDDGLEILIKKTTYPNGKPTREEEYHYNKDGEVVWYSEKDGELTNYHKVNG